MESGLAHLALLTETVRTLVDQLRDNGISIAIDLPTFIPRSALSSKSAKAKVEVGLSEVKSGVSAWPVESLESSMVSRDVHLNENDQISETSFAMPTVTTTTFEASRSPRLGSFGLDSTPQWTKSAATLTTPSLGLQSTSSGQTPDFLHDIFDFGPRVKSQPTSGFVSTAVEEAPLGSEDARPNIIKKGTITNFTAKHLVS